MQLHFCSWYTVFKAQTTLYHSERLGPNHHMLLLCWGLSKVLMKWQVFTIKSDKWRKEAKKSKQSLLPAYCIIGHWHSEVLFRRLNPFKRTDVQFMISDACHKLESLETESEHLCLLKSDWCFVSLLHWLDPQFKLRLRNWPHNVVKEKFICIRHNLCISCA